MRYKMRLTRLAPLAGCLVIALTVAALLGVTAASAVAAPVLDVNARWGPTILKPGTIAAPAPGDPGDGEYAIRVRNLGDQETTGPVTVTAELPPGVTRIPPTEIDEFFANFSTHQGPEGTGWTCSGTSTVTCTNVAGYEFDSIPAGNEIPALPFSSMAPLSPDFGAYGRAPGLPSPIYLRVNVAPNAVPGTYPSAVSVSGGGAVTATEVNRITVGNAEASFGLVQEGFSSDVFDARRPAGDRLRQAASHPFELRVDFDLALDAGEDPSIAPGVISPPSYTMPVDNARTVETTLPVGLIGNPEATPKCDADNFLTSGASTYTSTGCPSDTQVGVLDLELNGQSNSTLNHGFGALFSPATPTRIPVYNLIPPRGQVADFGFVIGDYHGHIYPTLDPARGYAIRASAPYISQILPVRSAEFTMWGVPADPAHDALRAIPKSEGGTAMKAYGAPSSRIVKPFLSLPASCGEHGGVKFRADSWQAPGQWTPVEEAAPGLNTTGCDDPRIRFEPEVALQPTSRAAGGPTGLQVDLKVPQRDHTVTDASLLYEQNGSVHGVDTPPMKKAVVTMPEGMTISTSAAQGLGNCSPEQIGLGTDRPVTCPDNSQYGTLTLHTPILPKDAPMTGQIFVAKQNDNPFNNFLSLYLVVQDPERGLLVKIPGKVDLDPVTGQITTTFDDLPQFPVTDMELNLKGGVRAALVNPSTCGTKKITATFYSWHDPNTPITGSSSYEIREKSDGSPCVNNLRDRRFKPEMSAGTLNPSAGKYSPFVFRTTRSDDDQEFSQLNVGLPKGLLANISGIAKCSDAAIRSAEAPGRTGAEERDHPSCPSSSLIGSTDVGSGVGQVLTYIPGKAYLAGPYKGAPLSMVVITPILAGPYDLGVIAVRSKIDVDRITTQAKVITDPFPQIFKGIPVRIRDVRVKVDRDRTTINPTNCSPMEVTSHITGTGGDVNSTGDDTGANLSSRFQAADCAALPFKPQLRFRLKGGTHRGDYPAFTATLKARPGEANIARTAVTLPRSEFLAQEHIRTVCTRVQFAQNNCPDASIYGHASATSPLFDETLQGPVYLRSSSNLLPDLVAKLDGEIDVELSGRIDSKNRGIRNTFDVVPDAPVDTFTLSMQGGKKGLLVNSTNLCKGTHRADVRMTGQNGKTYNSKPVLASSCKKRKAKKAKAHKRSAKARR